MILFPTLIDPVEEIPSIVATKAAEASDGDTTESGSVQDDDDYTGLDWNKVLRYQRTHSSLKRAPSYIWDHGWRLQQRYGAKSTVWLCKHCYKHDIKVTLYKTGKATSSAKTHLTKDIEGYQIGQDGETIDYPS